MNQGGVKHAAADQPRLDNKRERRRGAAGRAAALRRAPSDSDCSGETASLSADSGDRVLRPQPQPPRSGKSRSRRRGSEWEVLEGLKDGQRFDKRPDVFNGYLHKKRKWPLKGWHKRFFVVDGGILVYARSPTDVARGRLHGSVDVGLSVISAKARRRRIDIDADEFIYHLRAKTPDVFRTWLNVLKAHRLYRQHLLTFGARESVPKIHAPLDELPPTDTSSRASNVSSEMSSHSEDYDKSHTSRLQNSCATDSVIQRHQFDASNVDNESKKNFATHNCMENCTTKTFQNKLYNKSLCSMNCARRFCNVDPVGSAEASNGSTETEKQIHCTELDNSSFKSNEPVQISVPICNIALNSDSASSRTPKQFGDCKISSISQRNVCKDKNKREKTCLFSRKGRPTNAYFLFTRNKISSEVTECPMKRSRKSTNLIKYKNILNEPPLKKPLSKCMLLRKYKLKASKQVVTEKGHNRAVACDPVSKENNEIQVNIDNKANKQLQHVATASDYDKITERLMVTIFERHKSTDKGDEVKYYVNQVVRDLYDEKTNQEQHPVKALFKSLLEYWLKHSSIGQIKEAMTKAKSIQKPSNKHFTKDENLSSNVIDQTCKETQFHGLSDIIVELTTRKNTRHTHRITTENKNPLEYHNPRHDTESFEKEKRIQELEKLLKNTVYICETGLSHSREKDIKITKTLINNIGKCSSRFDDKTDDTANEMSNSSSELPKIQETINKLISETSIPPDVAKEFFNAYLDVLRHDSSRSGTYTSTQSSDNVDDTKRPICDVRTETIVKKISKSVTTLKPADIEGSKAEKTVDPGQMYLKDVLDKITTIFSKVKRSDDKPWFSSAKEEPKKENKIDVKDDLAKLIKDNGKEIICEKVDENSLVIDLSKYNLENITMADDPATKGTMSINIKLKEKLDAPKAKRAHLSLKFSNDSKPQIRTNNWFPCQTPSRTSDDIFNRFSMGIPKPFDCRKEIIDLKPYISTSDGTSNAFKFMNESEDSLNMSFSHNIFQDKESFENDMKSCFIMSTMKKNTVTKYQCKKKVRLKDGIALDSKTDIPLSPSEHNEEVKVFEKPTPRIIDEKFILLLLGNLTLLSKGVPSIHKEISNLFAKLKKKCGKVVKTSPNVQGLSLLGKIYNDTTKLNDNETQFEDTANTMNTNNLKETLNTGVNTKTEEDKIVTNKSITALHQTKEVVNNYVQTEEVTKANKSSTRIDNLVPNVPQTRNITETKESSTSNHNSRGTQERAVSTIVKSIPNNDDENYHNTARPIKIDTDMLKRRKYVPKPPEELIQEISILSPCLKVSKQSQTERMMVVLRDRDVDLKVYQMSLCQKYVPTRRSSLTDSNAGVSWSDELKTLYRCTSDPYCSGLISPTSPPIRGPQFVSGTPGGRLASWIIESGGPLENASRELGQAQLSIQQLQRLLDALELQQQVHHDTDVSLEGASPNVKKDRRKFGLRKKKSNSKCASVELAPPHIDPSSSHMALSALTAPPSPGGGASSVPNSAASLPIACAAARPQSLPGAEALGPTAGPASISSLTPDHQLREDFTVLAKDLLASLKSIVATLVCERGRLRAAMEAADPAGAPGGSVMAALRTNLTSALQQNSELRSRLSRIHLASDLAEISSIGPNSDPQARQFQQSLSYSSSCVSASEFFDAEQHEDDLKRDEVIAADEAGVIELDGDSSSEAGSLSSEEGSASSDNSEVLSAEQETLRLNANGTDSRAAGGGGWSRRTRLPAVRPTPGGPSLWNLLYKNIGKDLSQISMPVTINEPLNMLQRLCEELEYSHLLDAAASCACAPERMSLVAAFAVSAYAAAAHRAASKPFNPLLAETYECVRDDRNFHFIAEQVSHHPPISTCHAESSRWCFWQEARIKTKFWGKSMEFQPTGRVHVRLTTTGDHYSWNKVTTCVHNLFGGQRWVDQYGDMHIVCHGTDITCKLNFIKASSWSSSRHEVRGFVTEGSSGNRLRITGRWSEALYAGDPPAARCLWRPGAMPPDHELYYGFTRFAMELNEMEPGMRELLPYTDTRLRPDQRALEEGDVEAAEQLKHELEQSQRERRRDSPEHTPAWFRKSVEGGEETWVFTGEYWRARDNGFPHLAAPRIW